MSDAALGSPDSQAAWTALGDRMRRHRRRLLSVLLALGCYMGTQAWLHWRRDAGDEVAVPEVATARPASSLPPEESVAPSSPVPKSPRTAAAKARARSQTNISPRPPSAPPAAAPGESKSTAELAAPSTGEPVRTIPQTESVEDRPADVRPAPAGPPEPRWHAPPRSATRSTPEARLFAAAGGYLGNRLVRWSSDAATAGEARLRESVAGLIRFARAAERAGSPRPTASTPEFQANHTSAPVPYPDGDPVTGTLLVNSRETGGPIHYLVNGGERTLRPGESQRLPPGRWLVEFDRGGDFGEQAQVIGRGVYHFRPTTRGWQIVGPEPTVGQR